MRFVWAVLAGLVIVFVVLAGVAAGDVARFDVARLAQATPARTALMRQRENEARKKGRVLRIDGRTVLDLYGGHCVNTLGAP